MQTPKEGAPPSVEAGIWSTLRGWKLAAVIALAAFTPIGIEQLVGPHLVINHTASLPPGIYWRWRVPVAGPQRGNLVIACPPTAFARFGHDTGLLDVGECDGTESQLKIVVGVAGDRIHLDSNGVLVNGRFISGSRPLTHDGSGREVPHIAYGDYVLGPSDVWLASPKPQSFDSRYYGPVQRVLSIAYPIILTGS